MFFAGHVELGGDVFRRDSHVVVVEGAPQTILDHRVNDFAVAHPVTPASLAVQNIRCLTHAFGSTGNDDFGIIGHNRLHGEVDGFQAGAANLIYSKRRNYIRNAGLDCALPCNILSQSRLQNIAENNLIHLVRLNLGSFYCFGDGHRTQVGRRKRCQSPVKGTDWSPNRTDNNYFFHDTIPFLS